MPTFRKSPRLKGFDYRGPLSCHLTFVTRQREPLFSKQDLAYICLEALFEASRKIDATVHAYCLMPDHVHLLVEVGQRGSVAEFAHDFRQLSGYRLKLATGKPAWQISYYDHILRAEEDLDRVANYIWANPVEAGLAANPKDYEFSGPKELMA
jgi:REP element-mobilizing transposase RayT